MQSEVNPHNFNIPEAKPTTLRTSNRNRIVHKSWKFRNNRTKEFEQFRNLGTVNATKPRAYI